jgi:hypothetical protein
MLVRTHRALLRRELVSFVHLQQRFSANLSQWVSLTTSLQ